MTSNVLHRKWRPGTFDELIGHDTVKRALMKQLDGGRQTTFLFTGDSGLGKTTFGRIVANYVGCPPTNVIELDAATNNGKDDMRKVIETARYTGLGSNNVKVYIIDECHEITKQAWQALLKTLEEPIDGVYFILCTTEPAKVPKTIVTRCAHYALKPLDDDHMLTLLERVADDEHMVHITDEVLDLVVSKAQGSPRQALQLLSKAEGTSNLEELEDIFDEVSADSGEVIDLAKLLVFGGKNATWAKAQALIRALKDQNPESIRIVTVNYTAACLMNEKNPKNALRMLAVLDAFSGTFNPSDKMAPVLLAVGDLLLGD